MKAKKGVGLMARFVGQARAFLLTAATVVLVDQVTKWWALSRLTDAFLGPDGKKLSFVTQAQRFFFHKHPNRGSAIELVENFFHFRYVENPGAAWGFLARSADKFRTPFFLVISVLAMIFIIGYFRNTSKEQRLLRFSLALLFGGAIGNFFDRLRLGYVIDFVDLHWYEVATWPTFNVADAAITGGVLLLVWDMFRHKRAV